MKLHEKDERGSVVVHCVVLTRNGCGDAWRFSDLRAARLHPIPQLDDVYASNADQLVEQYGRGLIDDLLRFAEGRDRARLVNAFEVWRSGLSLPQEIRELLWSKVYGAAATPPNDPAELIRIIKGDRLFREGRVLRSIGLNERSPAFTPSNNKRGNEKMADRKSRINENDVITITTEGGANPKRAGSKAFEQFALYQDGMTVKEAKEAGINATDIAYNVAHDFISLTPGEPVEDEASADDAEAAEVAPKKKRAARTAAA